MIVEHYTLEYTTRGDDHIVDMTRQVQDAVAGSGISIGQAALLVHGSTAALPPWNTNLVSWTMTLQLQWNE